MKKQTKDFINKGVNIFIDIDSELERSYMFPSGNVRTIENPLKLCAKENGHRIWDAQNISHYIPSGWEQLSWKVKEGEANFVK